MAKESSAASSGPYRCRTESNAEWPDVEVRRRVLEELSQRPLGAARRLNSWRKNRTSGK